MKSFEDIKTEVKNVNSWGGAGKKPYFTAEAYARLYKEHTERLLAEIRLLQYKLECTEKVKAELQTRIACMIEQSEDLEEFPGPGSLLGT